MTIRNLMPAVPDGLPKLISNHILRDTTMQNIPTLAATRQSADIPACISHRCFPKRRYVSGGALFYFCFLFSAFCFGASGQTYSIDWYKVSDGGGASTGGIYQVTGTIGQPDASGAMSGGSYSVTGGFWSLYAVQTLGAPVLSIKLTSTNTTMVYWPSPSTGYSLQVNTNLATINWVTPAETVTDNGTIKYIIVNPPTGNRFYRLKQ